MRLRRYRSSSRSRRSDCSRSVGTADQSTASKKRSALSKRSLFRFRRRRRGEDDGSNDDDNSLASAFQRDLEQEVLGLSKSATEDSSPPAPAAAADDAASTSLLDEAASLPGGFSREDQSMGGTVKSEPLRRSCCNDGDCPRCRGRRWRRAQRMRREILARDQLERELVAQNEMLNASVVESDLLDVNVMEALGSVPKCECGLIEDLCAANELIADMMTDAIFNPDLACGPETCGGSEGRTESGSEEGRETAEEERDNGSARTSEEF